MGLRALLVDWGVTSGPSVAVLALQRAAGTDEDGVLGPVTVAAANRLDAGRLAAFVLAHREQFYRRIAVEDPSQERFLAGWLARCQEFAA